MIKLRKYMMMAVGFLMWLALPVTPRRIALVWLVRYFRAAKRYQRSRGVLPKAEALRPNPGWEKR